MDIPNRGSERGRKHCVTQPNNPFAAADAGAVYARGRPYHHPRTLGRIRDRVGATTIDTGLDIACGTGMSSVALAEHATTVAAVDLSMEMLRAAVPAPGVYYMFANAERLPFPRGAFDAATCCSGIHWFDQDRFFAELHRVLRSDAWVGLYDHYYVGEMVDVPEFGDWTRTAFERYPLPPRTHQVGDPRAELPAGFELVGDDLFGDDIEMSPETFADYQLTISNFVAAVEGGTPRSELRDWILGTTEPFFAGHAQRTIRFLGSIRCLRRASVA
jgi:SAM-dependent methyltransferase